MKLIFLLVAFFILTKVAVAETTKTIFNPFTGKLDFITALSSTTISSVGAALTCPNNPQGLLLTDSVNCTWCETVATTGNLITTLISCPATTVFRPCTTGMSLGLLASITCP